MGGPSVGGDRKWPGSWRLTLWGRSSVLCPRQGTLGVEGKWKGLHSNPGFPRL